MGDDKHSWAVFIDGIPFITGLSRSEVPYYKKEAAKHHAKALTGQKRLKPPQDERLSDPTVAAEYAEEIAAGQHNGL